MWCFNNIIDYFYLSGASENDDAVGIYSFAVELDNSKCFAPSIDFHYVPYLFPEF